MLEQCENGHGTLWENQSGKRCGIFSSYKQLAGRSERLQRENQKTRGWGVGANHREQGGEKRKNNKIQLNASEQTHRATRKCSFVYANTRCQHINHILSVRVRYSRTAAVFYRNPLTPHVTSTAHNNWQRCAGLSVRLGSFKHLAKHVLLSNQLFFLWGHTNLPWCFQNKRVIPRFWLSELTLAPTFMGKRTLKPYATVVRSRRRGASLGGEVIPDKKKAVCYLPLRFVLLCFSSGLPSAAAGG